MLVIYRSSPFYLNPALSFIGVVGFEPCPKLSSIGYNEDVMLFHKFRFICLIYLSCPFKADFVFVCYDSVILASRW